MIASSNRQQGQTPAVRATKAARPCATDLHWRGQRSRTLDGAKDVIGSAGIAECRNGSSPAPARTALASKLMGAICLLSGTARSLSKTLIVKIARPSAEPSVDFWTVRMQGACGMDMKVASTSGLAGYDPAYDPLVDPNPGCGRDYAPTYWVATAGPPPADDGPIDRDIDVDVAIVGSGFTGLACALFLAQEFGIKAHVLEANRVIWGCTSRNGGQAQNASGRLKRSQWIKRWGKDVALRMHAEVRDGFDTFKQLIRDIDCDAQPGGHLYIA